MSETVKIHGDGPIVVPTDFTNHSMAALGFALELAAPAQREVICLHVVHDPSHAPGYYQERSADGVKTMDQVASEMMAEFLQSAADEFPKAALELVTPKLVDGIPSRRISEFADTVDAFMIIMGSHGRRGVKAYLIGSKSDTVVKRASMPVAIVKAPKVRAMLTEIEAGEHKKDKDQ